MRMVTELHDALIRDGTTAFKNGLETPAPARPTVSETLAWKSRKRSPSCATNANPLGVEQIESGADVPTATLTALTAKLLVEKSPVTWKMFFDLNTINEPTMPPS